MLECLSIYCGCFINFIHVNVLLRSDTRIAVLNVCRKPRGGDFLSFISFAHMTLWLTMIAKSCNCKRSISILYEKKMYKKKLREVLLCMPLKLSWLLKICNVKFYMYPLQSLMSYFCYLVFNRVCFVILLKTQ